jgi:hypothetical protein
MLFVTTASWDNVIPPQADDEVACGGAIAPVRPV